MMCDLVVEGGMVLAGGSDALTGASHSIGITGDRIVYVGPGDDAPDARKRWDVEGRVVSAGLVDAHTHLVFGGDRLVDFRRRIDGDDYAAIASSGGGIRSTVAATREATDRQLLDGAKQRLRWLAQSGVTTVEVKSGYGLDVVTEIRMLQVARQAGAEAGVDVRPTLLGAHVVPTGVDREEYVAMVCGELIPAAVGLAEAFDVFIERIAFSAEEADRMFRAAAAVGLPIKGHVGQLADVGGAQVCADHGALSIDHCEHVPPSAMAALADNGTVATLVPGASVFLGEAARPPIDDFRSHGIAMAVTTDLNPGSSPLASLPLAGSLAIHRFGLTASEAYAGMTSVAAQALGLDDRGQVQVGLRADLAIWDFGEPLELLYWMGAPTCHAVVTGGVPTVWTPS